MRNSIKIFIVGVTILCLTAFGFITWNDSETGETSNNDSVATVKLEEINKEVKIDFPFSVSTQFRGIKKGKLDNVTSFADFIGQKHADRIVSYNSLRVIVLEDGEQTDNQETTDSGLLSPAQLELLQSLDYSTNILIWADYQETNPETGKVEKSYWTPYLTIVPEKEAVYVDGSDALIDYFKENSGVKTITVRKDQLRPGQLYFTVTKKGTISDVKLAGTSGYPAIDKAVIEMINKAPGKWEPAENAKGEKIDQKLVISFGSMGC